MSERTKYPDYKLTALQNRCIATFEELVAIEWQITYTTQDEYLERLERQKDHAAGELSELESDFLAHGGLADKLSSAKSETLIKKYEDLGKKWSFELSEAKRLQIQREMDFIEAKVNNLSS